MSESCSKTPLKSQDAVLKLLDITVDPKDTANDGYRVLEAIRPEWKREDVQLKHYSEGWVNNTLRFSLKSDADYKDCLIVRVYGTFRLKGQDRIALEKDAQVIAMQIAHRAGIAQPVMAIFKNGIVYRFAAGRTLLPEDVQNPHIIRLMCHTAAGFHSPDWDSIKAYNMSGELVCLDAQKESLLTAPEMTENNMNMIPEKLTNPEKDKIMRSTFPSKQEMQDLYYKARMRMDKTIPKTFQHNDFHIKNMVYSPDGEMLSLLDYELVGQYWTGGDISRIPALASIWKELGLADRNVEYTNDDMSLYARIYMEEKYKILGLNPDDVNDKEIELFHWQILMCWAFSDLLMGIVMLGSADHSIETKETEQEGFVTSWDSFAMAVKLYRSFKEKEDFFFNSPIPC